MAPTSTLQNRNSAAPGLIHAGSGHHHKFSIAMSMQLLLAAAPRHKLGLLLATISCSSGCTISEEITRAPAYITSRLQRLSWQPIHAQ